MLNEKQIREIARLVVEQVYDLQVEETTTCAMCIEFAAELIGDYIEEEKESNLTLTPQPNIS